ncbi:MAG: Spy/CpxP family protein refolding chaperone [Geminicoccaceae bacterium]
MIRGSLFSLLGLLVTAGAAAAAERSPYAGWQERNVKALSRQQLEDYLEGRGMSMALPAELNGYPGPRHVLELADELDLTADQLARTRRLFDDMGLQAIELGEQIVAREALLDELFASGRASEASLRDAAEVLGLLNGRLRGHHLGYHLAMRELLDPRQIQSYRRLRGYAAPTGSGEHGHGHAGHGAR